MVVLVGPHPDASSTVHLFEGPFVTTGTRRLAVPEGSKRLLAFVALRHGRVERRVAAGVLWPSNDDDRAAGNLRSALWRLRRAGIDLLDADKWSIELRHGVSVDLHHMMEWADRLIGNTALPGDLVMFRNRIDGLDLLPGWYDDWAVLERERIRQRMLHALEALSNLLVGAGRCAEAVDVAMAVVNAEPLRESAQRVLFEVHLAEGNCGEALRTYDVFRTLARRELGVDPSRDFTARARALQPDPGIAVPHARGAGSRMPQPADFR